MMQDDKDDMMGKKVRAVIDALMPAAHVLLDIKTDFDIVGDLPSLAVDPTSDYISFVSNGFFLTRNHFDPSKWTAKYGDDEIEIKITEQEVKG